VSQRFEPVAGGRTAIDYNGEPGVLEKLLDKLNTNDGLALLLTTSKGFPHAIEFIPKHPDRFVGSADIKLDDPNVLSEIDRFHDAGFRGLGEITKTQKNYDNPAYWPIYDRAEKYHMILIFHTGIVNRLHPEEPENVSCESPYAGWKYQRFRENCIRLRCF
jgi:hypothetical protein